MYSAEKNVQILISLLKKHNIKRVIVSPGMTNVSFVASIQNDPFFTVYSCVDERSAAYMACGMAAETTEPVVISCTGATASRNYYPALTEAYYRQLPILAVTSSQPSIRIGQNIPQITNRGQVPSDVVKYSVELPAIRTNEEYWYCNLKANEAILELNHHTAGPVHINLITVYDQDFKAKELPDERVIHRICAEDLFPDITGKRIAVFVGAHQRWSNELEEAVDLFCEKYNAVVICDSTSNYHGKYGVFGNIVTNQYLAKMDCRNMDLLIHIGAMSGSYMRLSPKKVWRINPDGKLVDTFKALSYVFEMNEIAFFSHYDQVVKEGSSLSYFEEWKAEASKLMSLIPELPFSGLWIAGELKNKLPEGARLHMGILNSLRCQNYNGLPLSIEGYCNVGGFGIDGCVSSMIGSAAVNPDTVHIAVVGDLAFFYDLNVLGNRHVNNNVRILVVNNGKGFEFKKYDCFPVAAGLADDINKFTAAEGHNSTEEKTTIKLIAAAYGFDYYRAESKDEFTQILPILTSSEIGNKPVLIEAVTNEDQENEAQYVIEHLAEDGRGHFKKAVKELIGAEKIKRLKNLF